MNAATTARIAAWNIIATQPPPAGTKVAVEDGWITITLPATGSRPAPHTAPADTPSSLCNALKDAARTTPQDPR